MATWTREFAFEQLVKHEAVIRAAYGTNEATTRMRAIDTLLHDVLGWEKTEIESEKYARAEGFADYVILENKSTLLVLEAKRSGATFLLPDREYADTPVGFALIAEECKPADSAFRQVLGYAASFAPRYIAISNGHQWIVALAWVNNQTIEERSVFVFESIDAIKRKFSRFWECFSPEGVKKNFAASLLLESRKAPAPSKLSEHIPGYPIPATRNTLVNQLEAVIGAVLEEVKREEKTEEFLNECYVEPESNASSLAYAREILNQRVEADERIACEAIDAQHVSSMIQTYRAEKPIIVLGRVGHGKSTFLQYLRKVKAKTAFDKYYQIEIDCIYRPETRDSVSKFVYDEIERQLRENYDISLSDDNIVRGALYNDLDRFSRSVEGKAHSPDSPAYKKAELQFIKDILQDRHVFLQKVFHHFRAGRKSSVAIFFDNLDRRDVDIQEEAFLRASALARDWAALVFVCLRPGTFYHSRKQGVLDSVAPKVINVVSPKTQAMVEKRLRFAKRIALGESPIKIPFGPVISGELPRTAVFLDCVAESFARSRSLANLFDLVSNGNARDLLIYLSQVLSSQHLDTEKIVSKYQTLGRYILAEHEVLRALLYGDSRQYDPRASQFINLFDIQRADTSEHFTKLLVLHHLRRAPDGNPNYGFIPVDNVLRFLYQLNFSEEHCKETLALLLSKRCCEARNLVDSWESSVKEIRITPLGKYHITELVKTFVYMDAIVVDTPILNAKTSKHIGDVENIHHRLERCRYFLEYLGECAASVKDIECQQIWREVSTAVTSNIATIVESLKAARH